MRAHTIRTVLSSGLVVGSVVLTSAVLASVVLASVVAAGDENPAVSPGAAPAEVAATAGGIEGRIFGDGVSAADTILVSELLAHPDEHLGETVRVEGTVVDCCKKRGCWIEIASDQEFQTIMLKVEDGEIVFPVEIIGDHAIVEGTLEGVPMGYDQACAYLEHEASCQGKTFDKTAVPEEGITFYRIKGTGAVVRES